MPYSELIKNFDTIRDYMRDFYLYGFKSRGEYDRKSTRSYDDCRRRIESWLSDSMSFRNTSDGKTVFLSVDSRAEGPNPFFKAWKSKSFTDGDITLHFFLFDILSEERECTLKEIMEKIDLYLEGFSGTKVFDQSTVRKKLSEYEKEGLITSRKEGRLVYYRCAKMTGLPSSDLLRFFAETAPCGVIGSFLEDKRPLKEPVFRFKHHYLTGTIDSEVLCGIFLAMQEKRAVHVELFSRKKDTRTSDTLIPLKVKISTQSGRQHLIGFSLKNEAYRSVRIDQITELTMCEEIEYFDAAREKLAHQEEHLWGASIGPRLEHVFFTVAYGKYEQHIPDRLMREKRCGTVTEVGEGLIRYEADVFDSSELVPWIRTFIGRIVDVHFSNGAVEKRFLSDIKKMAEVYGLDAGADGSGEERPKGEAAADGGRQEGGADDAVQ
ncbi:MAG: WYL domain-containing protein [Clostridiales bacterium]|nr:WYL domain-containing protein [Clostridiales bacterium]